MQHVRCKRCKVGISKTQYKVKAGYCGDCAKKEFKAGYFFNRLF